MCPNFVCPQIQGIIYLDISAIIHQSPCCYVVTRSKIGLLNCVYSLKSNINPEVFKSWRINLLTFSERSKAVAQLVLVAP